MIVEFIEGRDFMTAWVLSPASHRVAVLGLNGREMTVSRNRLLNFQDSPDPGDKRGRLELLRAADATRRELASGISLDELWEVLEGEGDDFPFEVLSSLYFGASPGVDEISAVSRAVLSDGLKFRFTPEGAVRNSRAEADRLTQARVEAEKTEMSIERVSQWIRGSLSGKVAPEPDEAPEAVELLTNLALWPEKAEKKQIAKKILEKVGLSPDDNGAFKALVALGHFSPHENIHLLRLSIPLTFKEETLRAVAAVTSPAAPVSKRVERLDLTALNTLTIDSNGARDLDDAVSIKSLAGGRWQVAIHITDVAYFIHHDSILDQEARARASSIYLSDGKYPMLPTELSEGFLSLTLGDVKPAFSFLATVESNGEVSEYSLAPSLIRVDRQLSFSEADHLLNDDSDLVDLWDIAQALMAWREARGGVNLDIPRLNIYFLPDGSLSVGLTQWDTPAKVIIGELMILANHLAADFLHKNAYPCPYRYQEKPSSYREDRECPPPVIGVKADADAILAGNLAARRRTGRSGLSFIPAAHHGLGLPVYTSFTAPMRRYVDLLVARQLRSLVEGGPPLMDQQEFLRLALPAFDLAQGIQKMQNMRQRYWLKKHLSDKIGREFSALVFDQNERRLRVCVTDYMLESDLFLPKGDGGRVQNFLGRRLKVRLAAVPAADEDWPRFEIVG